MARKKNKTDMYKKRQNLLLGIIGTVLVILILILAYIIAFDDKKEISQNTVSNAAVESSQLAETESSSEEASVLQFENETIELYTGETTIPTVLNGSIDMLYDWQSADEKIATVNENGEITGISEGSTVIEVFAKTESNFPITLNVNVIKDENTPEIVEENGLTYIDGILIANKTYSLPSDYEPGVDDEAAAAFDEMQQAAANEGLNIYIASGFRSYDTQKRLYNNYAARDGYEAADRYSARPGHSEHQTGLAFDLNSIDDSFAYTAEGEWVKNNCHKYGFIIRYPEGKEEITGYMYESWHIRYLGVDKATEVYESGLTLEEFLGIDSVYAE